MSALRIGITGATGFLGSSLLGHFGGLPNVHVVALSADRAAAGAAESEPRMASGRVNLGARL